MGRMKNEPSSPRDFAALCRQRLSCRNYRSDPVPAESLTAILEAARLAPSACNRQPWRFAVVTSADTRRRLVDDGLLPGLPMRWALEAPVILVLGMKKSFVTHQLAPAVSGVDYAMLDLGIAGEHAVLQATELGLGTCWIGWIRPDAIRRIVKWPRDITPQALITLGWPKDPPPLPRDRLPLSEIAVWR